jgi:outer membrane protein assembly factor BamB
MSRSKDSPVWHDYLFVGTHGHVVALNKKSGRKVWDCSLPSTGFSIVSIVVEDGFLFCASGGRAFALDPETGEIRWTNALKGLGSSFVYLCTAKSNSTEHMMTVLASAAQSAQAAAAAGASGAT